MTGSGDRDVGQAQVLAALLGQVLLAVALPYRTLETDIDAALLARLGVVEGDRHVRRDVARLPQEWDVDDRELQALAPVHGEDLHRGRVGLQPAASVLVGGVRPGVGDAPAQPAGERGHAELLLHGGAVQELADVAQVGEAAARRPSG